MQQEAVRTVNRQKQRLDQQKNSRDEHFHILLDLSKEAEPEEFFSAVASAVTNGMISHLQLKCLGW